jgi:hypothetical protein
MLDAVEFIALKRLVPNPRSYSVWKHETLNGYVEQHLLGDYMEKMFQAHIRLGYNTFNFLVDIRVIR